MSETSSLYLPGQGKNDGWVIYPEVGTYSAEPEDMTMVLESYGGNEQRRIMWPIGGRMHFIWRTPKLTAVQSRTFRNFLRSLRGRALTFNFFDFLRQDYAAEPCGTADGNTSLVLSFRDMRNVGTFYANGVSVGSFTLTPDIGNGRETRVNWTGTVPTAGQAITFDGEGYKRYCVRREMDRVVGRPFAGGSSWNDAVSAADLQWDLAFMEPI